MAGSPLHDFDAAWADDVDDPISIRLLGREWACKRPSEVPAALLLRMDRLLLSVATADGGVPDDFEVDASLSPESILRSLAGDANVDAWLDLGLPYSRLMAVNRHLMAVYRGQDPQGEAPAANRTQRRAAAKKKKAPASRSS